MSAVWKLGKATVRDVQETLDHETAGAYSSIATMMRFLERKGMLRHKKTGRVFYYYPTITLKKRTKNRNEIRL